MNCPNCNHPPVGVFNFLSTTDTSLKQKVSGLIRCQSCNTVLKHQRTPLGFKKYETAFYGYHFLIGVLLIAFVAYFGGQSQISSSISPTLELSLLIAIPVIVYFISIALLIQKYSLFEIVTDISKEAESVKLSKRSLAIFLGYLLVCTIILLVGVQQLSISEYNTITFILSFATLLAAILFIGVYFLLKMNRNRIQ